MNAVSKMHGMNYLKVWVLKLLDILNYVYYYYYYYYYYY